jgi:hypothetical protein
MRKSDKKFPSWCSRAVQKNNDKDQGLEIGQQHA